MAPEEVLLPLDARDLSDSRQRGLSACRSRSRRFGLQYRAPTLCSVCHSLCRAVTWPVCLCRGADPELQTQRMPPAATAHTHPSHTAVRPPHSTMAQAGSLVNLKVLSPSAEVEGGLSFPDVPASTTVKELRSRIQDAVPSKPAVERMRLIYRGRVVANDASTLGDVFGAESIRESKDQSLHLVLRELPVSDSASSSPGPRSNTAPPNPFRPAHPAAPPSPALQTNPFRTLPQPRPNSQPQLPPHHHHHPHLHHHHHVHGPPNPFQIPLPPAVEQHLAQTMGGQPGAPPPHQAPQSSSRGAPLENANPVPPTGLPPLPGLAGPHIPQNGTTTRHEGSGPNGERWSVTTFASTIIPGGVPQQPPQQAAFRPPMLPPHAQFGFPPPIMAMPPQPPAAETRNRILTQLRTVLDRARSEMGNVRTLVQSPELQGTQTDSPAGTPPIWRLERIRQHLREMERSLDLIDRGVDVLGAEHPSAPDLLALREAALDLRVQVNDVSRRLPSQDASQSPSDDTPAASMTAATGTAPDVPNSIPPTSAQPNHGPQSLPAGLPEELFLLSSPQGPVGLLFNQQGTFMTAPMASTLPFQTFTDQFARNRQIISGLGQHITHGAQINTPLANIADASTRNQATGQNTAQQAQPAPVQGQQPAQAQNQNQNNNQNANADGDDDRIGDIAGHLWLLLKLACFVYFFAGGGGWYKSIMLGVIAGGVYLAQLGIFDEYFNVIRRHFEAVLPVGALAERVVQGRNANARQPRTTPDRDLSPEEAARRLLHQQRNERFGWARETMRILERSFAIFVASLWPGIGERMVHAQEERERQERVAEQERQQHSEDARRQETEAQQNGEAKDTPVVEQEESGTTSKSRGKEKAVTAEDETTAASGSSS